MAMVAYKCSLSSPSKTGARVRVSPHSIVMEYPRMPSYQSTPTPTPLAPSRHMPCMPHPADTRHRALGGK